MLQPPYDRNELERLFGVELAVLRDLFSPVLTDFAECRSMLRGKGFVADQPYEALLRYASDALGDDCRSELSGADPDQVCLADLVELYPNRMLQFLPAWPTGRARYWACLGRAMHKEKRSAHDEALKKTWAPFAAEANRYPDVPPPSDTREGIVESVLRESLTSVGFAGFPVSKSSVRKWHPRPGWVDAVAGVLRRDEVDILLLTETSRPRKYAVLPDFTSEPNEPDTAFDKIDVSLWAVPRRKIIELSSAALKVRQRLFYYYSDFCSFKGLRRIVDAHATAARIMLGKV